EGNGGLIFPEYQYCRDGGMACVKLLEIIAAGTTLSEFAKSVPVYFNSKTKTVCKNLTATMERVTADVLKSVAKVDTMDGVKIWYDDGWVLIRPSGTEPIIRIFAESKTKAKAEELMLEGLELVERYQ
ncbi:MAG TPA: phosphoglucosamine mutase, partial [Methanosarcinaceae archaeon]|nr:phosphoglucosamine mutase [Methanosarcinaceae archaeon]